MLACRFTGYVPQGDGRSAGEPNRLHIHRPRLPQRPAAVARSAGTLPDWHGKPHLGEHTLEPAVRGEPPAPR